MSTETNEVKRNWNETDIPSLTGKTALITGANSGLGYELSRMLAAKGARVLMACRNPERGWAALEKIRSKQDSAKLDYVPLDLTDLKSVAKVGDELKRAGSYANRPPAQQRRHYGPAKAPYHRTGL